MEYFTGILKAFIVGGIFCLIAQILIDKTSFTPAKILVTYVICGVVLTAFGIYPNLVEFAGAGATVPLTGFGFTLAKGVEKAINKEGIFGILTGGLSSVSAGITFVMVSGFISSIISGSKPK